MTILIQFENNNWHAEGVAIMEDHIYNHPTMQRALKIIAAQNGFDHVTECERDVDYQIIHELVDDARVATSTLAKVIDATRQCVPKPHCSINQQDRKGSPMTPTSRAARPKA